MSLSDLASLGSFVSGVAVLASLIFLFVQMKQIGAQIDQAERNQRAAIRAERTSRIIDSMSALLEPSAAEAVALGNAASEAMSATQIRQFIWYCNARFINAEDAIDQHADGLLGDNAFEGLIATFKLALAAPGFRAAWRVQRAGFRGEFVAFMDGLLAQSPMATAVDSTAVYKAAFAAEKAKAPT